MGSGMERLTGKRIVGGERSNRKAIAWLVRIACMKDYYKILEISVGASQEEIKRAWHEQLQVWHPERFYHNAALREKAEARTRDINEAHEVLSNSQKRREYDSASWDKSQQGSSPNKSRESKKKVVISCPNPSCKTPLSVPKLKGTLRVRCTVCRTNFVFNPQNSTFENIEKPDSQKGADPRLDPTSTGRQRIISLLTIGLTIAIGRYLGITAVIPFFSALALWWIGDKYIKPERVAIVPILAIQGSQLIWMVMGLSVSGEVAHLILLDILFLLVSSVWIYRSQGKGPLSLALGYQAISMVWNITELADLAPSRPKDMLPMRSFRQQRSQPLPLSFGS
jgi:LSD1 subclass zinc finger protein